MTGEKAIVVTGMGVIAAAGDSPESLWQSVLRGVSPAALFTDPSVSDSPAIPACVVSSRGEPTLKLRGSHKMDRCVLLALEAAAQAHRSAGLDGRTPDQSTVGIMVGTSRAHAKVDRKRRSGAVGPARTAADAGRQQHDR